MICHRCLLAISLQDVKRETEPRRPTQPPDRLSLRRLWPPSTLHLILMVGGVVVLILLGLRIVWNPSLARRQIALDAERPVQVLMNLQFALEQYAVGHADQYPETLFQLLPIYLGDTPENRRALKVVDYRADERIGYKLQLKGQTSSSAQGLLLTRDRFHLPGFENVWEEKW